MGIEDFLFKIRVNFRYNCIFINEFKNISELKEGINSYVDKYNNRRFHSSIGYKKPMDVYLSAFKNAV